MNAMRFFWISLFMIMSCTPAKNQDIGTPIPLDPELRHGQLDNGFTYYIRNLQTDTLIYIKLLVPGRWSEDEDQLELAHFTEHVIVYGGTSNFPDFKSFMRQEDLPLQFSAASTSNEFVQYNFKIPINNHGLFTKVLRMLREYAWDEQVLNNVRTSIKVDNERTRMLQEINDPYKRTRYKLLGKTEGNKIYDPIGDDRIENIKTFKIASLTRFYKDWYRPDQQAIVIVGDIDVDQVEKQIRDLFSDMENPENAPEKDFQAWLDSTRVELTGQNQFVKFLDKTGDEIKLEVYMKDRAFKLENTVVTEEEYREKLIKQLYSKMMASRFRQLTEQYLSPFAWSVHHSWVEKHPKSAHINAIVTIAKLKDISSLQEALQMIMTELERVKQWGFTKAELTLAKENVLEPRIKRLKEPHVLARKYYDHLALGAAAPSPEYERELLVRLLEDITTDEVQAMAQKLLTGKNRDIVVTVPEIYRDSLPDKETVEGWLSEVWGKSVSPYREPTLPGSLLTEAQQKQLSGDIEYTQTEIAELGVTRLDLANGVRVLLKPLDASVKKTRFWGFSPGGASFYKGKDHITALMTTQIIQNSGAGGLDKFALGRVLKDKGVEVHPGINEKETLIRGSSSSLEEMEILLQGVYLYFTAPEKNEQAFKDWKKEAQRRLRERNSRTSDFRAAQISLVVRQEYPTKSDIAQVELDNVHRIYRERFAHAGDFTFAVTGDFTPDDIKPLLLKYLGNLPENPSPRNQVLSTKTTWKPRIGLDTTVVRKKENKARMPVEIYYFGKYKLDIAMDIKMKVLADVLKGMLWPRLIDIGLYTGGSSSAGYDHESGYYRIQITGDSDGADKTGRILDIMEEEIGKICEAGPDAKLLQHVIVDKKRQLKKERHNGTYKGRQWSVYLTGPYQEGRSDPTTVLHRSVSLLDQITAEDIRALAQQFFKKENRSRFIMLLENEKNAALFK